MERYDLIFRGEIREDATLEEVKHKLAELYSVDLRKIEGLFTGKPVYIRKSMDLVSALEDKEEFEATGAVLRIEPAEKPEFLPPYPRPTTTPTGPLFGKKLRPVGKRPSETQTGDRPSIPSALHLSFYSPGFYRRAAGRWKREAVVYLLLLSVFYSISAVYRFTSDVRQIVNASLPVVSGQIPDIRIEKGKVRIDADQPYFIKAADGDSVVAILDTTGRHQSLNDTTAVLLLTENRLLVRRSADQTREFDLSGMDGFHLNRERATSWMRSLMSWMPVVVFPFAVLAALAYRLLQALLFAGLGFAVAIGLKHPVTFQAAFTVAALALTPMILLDTVFNMIGAYPPFWGMIGLMISGGYMAFGIRSVVMKAEA
ncbi:MAG: DUF1189 domain-containing protein [Desulfobacterales bacterium]